MTIMPDRTEFDAIARLDFNTFVERVFVELNGSEPYLDNFHISGLRMPKDGPPFWSGQEIQLMRNWIAQGASGEDAE